MMFSIVYKLILGSIFLVTLSAGMVGGLFYSKTTGILIDHSIDDIAEQINNAGNRMQEHIEAQHDDVLFLSRVPSVQELLRAQKLNNDEAQAASVYRQWQQQLQSVFKAMLKSKPAYLKLRFIDKQGREIVVAGREGGQIVVYSGEQLQNKMRRAYVTETVKLSSGEVYFSDINLNREYGKVSVPYQEVLRTATPVYDEGNRLLAGLLVITADISHELKAIQDDVQEAGRNVYITNANGDYLLHPDSSKTYGFDLAELHRAQLDIPGVSKLFLPDNKDRQLILLPEETNDQYVVNFTKIPFDPDHSEHFVVVGITHLYSNIVAEQSGILEDAKILALVLSIGVVILAMLSAYSLSRPIKQMTRVMVDYTHQRKTNAIMPVDQNDEIGVLARSYKTLIGQVEEAKLGMRSMNKNLERMVFERTQKLKSSELYQRSIVENIADGLITIDDIGTVSSINPAAVEIFGYQPEEVIGENVKMLMSEPYRSEHDGYLQNYNQTGNKKVIGVSSDVEGQRKDGSVFPMELSITEMTVNGYKIFTGVVRDITERKLVEKMKNEFISTVSHELRTPLTSIRGSLGLICGGAVGEISEKANMLLTIASNNTERLLLLINDILDIQKMESGRMNFKFENLELMPFLKQALEDNAGYGDQHKVKFVIAKELDDALIYADKDRLMQVMANLLSNAAKFSPEGDEVEISVAQQQDDILRISVTDHGPGIPEEFHSKLFDKFTQSDSSDTRQVGGTGLGLSISKIIVEKHGGVIDFVSGEDVGTTFYVDLPKLIMDRHDHLNPSSVKGAPCILVVEDDLDVAALMKRMLAEAGYNSEIADNADKARELLKLNPDQYSAMTLDLLLPGESGLSLLESLRQEATSNDIPVVVVSVEADEAKRKLSGGAVGVSDWLNKPIDPQRLVDAVKQASVPGRLPRVLHVEDEVDVRKVVNVMLEDHCELIWANTFKDSKEKLESEEFDLVLLDVGLPDGSGLDLLKTIEGCDNPPRVVIFSAYDVTEEYAEKVNAVLVKSKTDNARLTEVIRSLIG